MGDGLKNNWGGWLEWGDMFSVALKTHGLQRFADLSD